MAWFDKPALTIPDIIVRAAESQRDSAAVIVDDEVVTWTEFEAGTARAANALRDLGLEKGDRVVVLMANGYEMVEAMFGAIRAGLCVVPLNCSITDDAVAGMIRNSAAKAIIASDSHIDRIETLRDDFDDALSRRLIGVAVHLPEWLDYASIRDRANCTAPDVQVDANDECNIIYSSGTTGLPKGIVHDHACREAWGSDMAVALRYHPGCRTLVNLGLFSNISWVAMLATFFCAGTLVIERRFDVSGTLRRIEALLITHFVMVPLQYQKLLESPAFDQYDLTSLRAYMCCGSPLSVSLKREIVERMPGDFIELYGLTEGLITILSPEDMSEKTASVGRPSPGQAIAIVDDNDRVVPTGDAGEIVGHARYMMAGYHDNDAANEEATWMDPKGQRWLRTGDIGRLDEDGFLYLVDRKKDMIISGGQNIYPADIEAVLSEHDSVSEVAVIGVPDEKWGETPLALVVTRGAASVDVDALRDWANARLGKQQRVSAVETIDELPRNPNGKVLKRELRKRYAEPTTC